jgi:hypothetical protein
MVFLLIQIAREKILKASPGNNANESKYRRNYGHKRHGNPQYVVERKHYHGFLSVPLALPIRRVRAAAWKGIGELHGVTSFSPLHSFVFALSAEVNTVPVAVVTKPNLLPAGTMPATQLHIAS